MQNERGAMRPRACCPQGSTPARRPAPQQARAACGSAAAAEKRAAPGPAPNQAPSTRHPTKHPTKHPAPGTQHPPILLAVPRVGHQVRALLVQRRRVQAAAARHQRRQRLLAAGAQARQAHGQAVEGAHSETVVRQQAPRLGRHRCAQVRAGAGERAASGGRRQTAMHGQAVQGQACSGGQRARGTRRAARACQRLCCGSVRSQSVAMPHARARARPAPKRKQAAAAHLRARPQPVRRDHRGVRVRPQQDAVLGGLDGARDDDVGRVLQAHGARERSARGAQGRRKLLPLPGMDRGDQHREAIQERGHRVRGSAGAEQQLRSDGLHPGCRLLSAGDARAVSNGGEGAGRRQPLFHFASSADTNWSISAIDRAVASIQHRIGFL